MLLGKETAGKRALLRNDKFTKGLRMAAEWRAHPEDVPAQSPWPESIVISVTDFSDGVPVLGCL